MVKIVIGGDTTTVELISPLKSFGFDVEELGFNQWEVEILRKDSQLHLNPPDFLIIVLSPRFQEIDRLASILAHLKGDFNVLFTTLFQDPLAPLPLAPKTSLNDLLKTFQKEHSWFHLVDMDYFFALHGVKALHDARFESIARMYFSPNGMQLLAKTLARSLHALTSVPKKVLALDLDQTLWGGIVGEEEIQIGQEGIGYAFTLFQRALITLKNNGILLAICSKNNESDVFKAFEKEMPLKLSDFAAYRINWKSKDENLKSLSEELNLNLDAFVFFDDSPFERQQLKTLLPQVDVIEVPKDPALYVETLSNYWGFDSLQTTDEDRKRSAYYSEDAKRNIEKSQWKNLDEFYKSLQMEGHIEPLTSQNFERVHQLIHKTNQFNLTGKRYSEIELQKLEHVYTFRLKDRYGDQGLTGVVVIQKEKNDWLIDSFLLSCRVLGRGVEVAILQWLAKKALDEGATHLIGLYEMNSKNQVAKDFYEEAGFTPKEDRWIFDLKHITTLPKSYVKIY